MQKLVKTIRITFIVTLFLVFLPLLLQENLLQAQRKAKNSIIITDEIAKQLIPIEKKNTYCFNGKPYVIRNNTKAISLAKVTKVRIRRLKNKTRSKLLKKELKKANKTCTEIKSSTSNKPQKSALNKNGNLRAYYSSYIDEFINRNDSDLRILDLKTTFGSNNGKEILYVAVNYIGKRSYLKQSTKLFAFQDNGKRLLNSRELESSIEYIRDIGFDKLHKRILVASKRGIKAFESNLGNTIWEYKNSVIKFKIADNSKKLIGLLPYNNLVILNTENGKQSATFRKYRHSVQRKYTYRSETYETPIYLDGISDVAISRDGETIFIAGYFTRNIEDIETNGFKLSDDVKLRTQSVRLGDLIYKSFDVPFVQAFRTKDLINNINDNTLWNVWGFTAEDIRNSGNRSLDYSKIVDIEIAPNNDLYILGETIDGGNSLFLWDGPNLSRSANVDQSGNIYSRASNSNNNSKVGYIGRIKANTGAISKGRFVVSRRANGVAGKTQMVKLSASNERVAIIGDYSNNSSRGNTNPINSDEITYINGKAINNFVSSSFFTVFNRDLTKRLRWGTLFSNIFADKKTFVHKINFLGMSLNRNKLLIAGYEKCGSYLFTTDDASQKEFSDNFLICRRGASRDSLNGGFISLLDLD